MIRIESICSPDTKAEKPLITEEEDRPFPISQGTNNNDGTLTTQDYPTLLKLNEQNHSHKVDNFKNIVGGVVLGVCIAIIVSFAIADAVFEIESSLFTGAFEFAKTIATAVIGYLFAANTKDK